MAVLSGFSFPHLMFRRSQGEMGTSFERKVSEIRISNLRLSRLRDIDNVQHHGPIMDLSLEQEEGRYLLAGGNDGSIYIHDMAVISDNARSTSKMVASVSKGSKYAHDKGVECVQWYPPDPGIFITSSMDSWIKVWDANKLRPVEKFNLTDRVNCHHMSDFATHQLLAVAAASNHAKLIDLKSGSCVHELRSKAKKSVITCRWSNSKENVLATGYGDGKVLVWDVRQAKSCLLDLDYNNLAHPSNSSRKRKSNETSTKAHDGFVVGLSFFPDGGKSLLTLGKDKKLRKWCLDTGKNLKARFPLLSTSKRLQTSLSVYSDYIFVPTNTGIHVLDLYDHSVINSLDGHFTGSANCCVFNTFNQDLYSGGNDRNILVYDANISLTRDHEEHVKKKDSGSDPNGLGSLANIVTVDAWSSDSDEDGDLF